MAETVYKVGDPYEYVYPDAPRTVLKQYKAGQQLSIRVDNTLAAIWEVEESDETTAKGKIVTVFRVKAPVEPRAEPRRALPVSNQRKKPL